MKKKRWLSLLLALIMMVSLLPLNVFAAEVGSDPAADTTVPVENTIVPEEESTNNEQPTENEQPADEPAPAEDEEPLAAMPAALSDDVAVAAARDTSGDGFYKILHLDCGRKYFSADWIKALINEMAAAGYNQLQLAFGNDGLRFLLDDMSVGSYTSAAVTEAIEAGNKAYFDAGEVNELTQTEMGGIIAHAKTKGIEIVPLLNSPGHMDAILTAMTQLGISSPAYSTSKTTVDLNNSAAVAFTQALVKKYVDYFKAAGCTFFNIGADEYANDINGTPRFSTMLTNGYYTKFVEYLNNLAEYVVGKGMTPRCFNDGVYYNEQTGYGTPNSSLEVCYWSSGWSGFDVASASFLGGKNVSLINTHGDYYYVLGKDDKFDSGYSYASGFSNTTFMGSTITNPVGSMFCIWCDFPDAETETEVAQKTRLVLRAMAARMDNKDISTISTDVVTGGFNVDGTINTASVDSGNGDLGDSSTPTTDKTVNVNLKVGETKIFEDVNADAGDYITDDNKYIATAKVTTTTTGGNTEYTPVTSIAAGEYYVSTKANDTNPSVKLTIEIDNGTYYLKNGEDQYIYPNGFRFLSWSYNVVTGEKQPITVRARNSGYSFSRSVTGGIVNPETKDIYLTLSGDSFDATGTSTTLYLYTKKDIEGTSSSALTITGVGEGNTSVVVGDTTYNITVTAPTTEENKTLYFSESFTPEGTDITITDGANIVSLAEGKIVAGTTADTATVTSAEKNQGGYVTQHHTYNITVAEKDLSEVTPLSIEYWITNGRVQEPKDSTSTSYSLSASDAYGEDGVAVTNFIPLTGIKVGGANTLDYWRCRLLDKTKANTIGEGTTKTEEQTTDSKDDETFSGTGFTKVRYYNSVWAVYTENNEWVPVESKHQLVAYYLEILNIATELKVNAADWGKKGDGSASNDYLPTSAYCTVSLRVVYEDGTINPAGTTAADLKGNTICYGYWSSHRGVGTLNLTGLEGYQIYKVEAETGASTLSFGNGEWGTATVTQFTWDNNAKTVYEGEPVDSYVIHNDANSPSKEGYYENLQWDENYEAILITVYVKAKPTDDSLRVVYFDEKFNSELYSYNIPVRSGCNFTNNIVNSSNTETPWANIPVFADSTTRKDVSGYGIVNTLDVTQRFQTDLTQVPEAVGKYNNGLYTYNGSELKDDGKTLYLYYTINTDVLKPIYVVDFGRPITFPLTAVVNETQTVEVVTISRQPAFGTLEYNTATENFTYTPTKILTQMDTLSISITFDGDSTATTTNVGVLPATSVFYEESFLTYSSGWTEDGTAPASQATEVLGQHSNNYGYDPAYSGVTTGSYKVSNTVGDTATFTFTGTGFQLYANSDANSGIVTVYRDGQVKKVYTIDTVLSAGSTAATENQTGGTYYSLPIISETALPYGTYTVTITHTNDTDPIYIDGVRVLGTMQDSNIYTEDLEDNPNFYELRDYVLKAIGVGKVANSTYGDVQNLAGQVYNGNNIGENSAIVIDTNASSYSTDNAGYAQDLLDNGPKNELYLYSGQTLVFKVTTNRVMQLGLKAPTGSANYSIKVNDGDAETKTLSTCVDMFYKIADKADSEMTHTVTITNTGDKVLSVTLLKICDDPNAAFATLTQDDIEGALLGIYGISKEETSEPTDPAEPTDPVEPTEPTDPDVPDEPDDEPDTLTTTLTVNYVNLFGRKVGTATLTKEMTDGSWRISAREINANAPAGRRALCLFPVTVNAGQQKTIVIPVL